MRVKPLLKDLNPGPYSSTPPTNQVTSTWAGRPTAVQLDYCDGPKKEIKRHRRIKNRV